MICYVRFHLRTPSPSSSTRSAFELSEPAFLWTSDKLSASIESLFCYHSPLKASFQRNHVCSKKVRSLNLLARPHPYYRGRGFYKSWPNVGAGQRLSIIILVYQYYISILYHISILVLLQRARQKLYHYYYYFYKSWPNVGALRAEVEYNVETCSPQRTLAINLIPICLRRQIPRTFILKSFGGRSALCILRYFSLHARGQDGEKEEPSYIPHIWTWQALF